MALSEHRAMMVVSLQVLCDALHLPEGTEIHGVFNDPKDWTVDRVLFHITSPGLKAVPPNCVAPQVTPSFQTEEDDAGHRRVRFLTWVSSEGGSNV